MKNLSNYSDAIWCQICRLEMNFAFIIILYSYMLSLVIPLNTYVYVLLNVPSNLKWIGRKIEIILMNFHVSFMEILMDRKCAKPSKMNIDHTEHTKNNNTIDSFDWGFACIPIRIIAHFYSHVIFCTTCFYHKSCLMYLCVWYYYCWITHPKWFPWFHTRNKFMKKKLLTS